MTDYIIAINCDRGYPEKPWRIGEFALDIPEDDDPLRVGADAAIDDPPMWVFGEVGKISRRRGIRGAREWIAPDDHPLTDDEIYGTMRFEDDGSVTVTEAGGIPEGSYLRWRLHCDRCGYTVTVRAQKLDVVLDRLAAGGVSAISLAGLARVL
jgi:hypothetical protein